MKIESKKSFSYAAIIFRSCQLLLVIGTIIQVLRLFTEPDAVISLMINLVVLLFSVIGERKVTKYMREVIEDEVEQITCIKDNMFADIELPVVIIEEVGNIKWCNKAFQELLKEKDILGKNIKSVFAEAKIGEWILEKQKTSLHIFNLSIYIL